MKIAFRAAYRSRSLSHPTAERMGNNTEEIVIAGKKQFDVWPNTNGTIA